MSWCGSHGGTPWPHHGDTMATIDMANTSLSRCLVVSCQGLRQSLHTTRQRCDVLDRCMSFDLFERWRRHLFDDMLEFKDWEVWQCMGLGRFLVFLTFCRCGSGMRFVHFRGSWIGSCMLVDRHGRCDSRLMVSHILDFIGAVATC